MIKIYKYNIIISILLFFIFLNNNKIIVSSKKITATLYSNGQFYYFLSKFCFENGGEIDVKVNWDEYDNRFANLLLFSDTIDNVVQGIQESTCLSHIQPNFIFNNTNDQNNKIFKFKSQRDRYWYFVLSQCGIQSPLTTKLEFEINLMNQGDSFDKYLSSDYHSVPQSQLFYILLGLILTIIIYYYKRYYVDNNLQATVLTCLSCIVLLSVFSNTILFLNFIYQIKNLPNSPKIIEIANWFYIFSKNLFYLLLIMIGQGYTTSIYYGSKLKRNIPCFFLTVFNIVLGWSLSFIYTYKNDEINAYVYYLDTTIGMSATFTTYTILTCYFIFCNIISYRTIQDDALPIRKSYLKIFTIIFSIYLISPIAITTISHYLANHIKFKVLTILNQSIDFLYFIIILIIFRPKSNNSFISLLIKNIDIELKDLNNDDESNNNNKTINVNSNNNNNNNNYLQQE